MFVKAEVHTQEGSADKLREREREREPWTFHWKKTRFTNFSSLNYSRFY